MRDDAVLNASSGVRDDATPVERPDPPAEEKASVWDRCATGVRDDGTLVEVDLGERSIAVAVVAETSPLLVHLSRDEVGAVTWKPARVAPVVGDVVLVARVGTRLVLIDRLEEV